MLELASILLFLMSLVLCGCGWSCCRSDIRDKKCGELCSGASWYWWMADEYSLAVDSQDCG